MKKKLFLTAMFLTFAGLIWAQSAQGVIQRITGEVEIKHPGSSVFTAAAEEEKISESAVISTGFRSTAIIAIGSSVITVRPLTRLTLAEIQSMENSENINVNLQTGRVRVEVKPPSGSRANFTLQSPSVTASVRGTIFETDGFNLNTVEGIVDVKGNNNAPAVPIAAGLSTYIDSEINPADPFAVALFASSIEPIEGAQDVSRKTAGSPAADGDLIMTPEL